MSLVSVQPSKFQDRTLDAAELGARYLYKTEGTIWSDLARAPDRLPPPVRIPGTRKTLWLESEVIDWLQKHSTGKAAPKRGRPTKRQQVERAQQSNGSAA